VNKLITETYHDFNKGEVVIVDFGKGFLSEKSGVRPAVIVSSNLINHTSDNIIVAPLTKSFNKKTDKGLTKLLATHIYLSERYYSRLGYSSIIQLEDMRSISKKRVKGKLETLSRQNYNEMNNKLRKTLDI